ncbi:MAG: hypothetical protein IMF12_05795, partial [Proteobacteria bacterium]|nr:hypothetical protein [Pseudomonadota bacterium]
NWGAGGAFDDDNIPTANGAWSFTNWPTTDAIDTDKYFEFTVDLTGYEDIHLKFEERRSDTGIGKFEVHYGVEGVTFTKIGTTETTVPDDESWRTTYDFDLSSISVIEEKSSISFRIYGYKAEGSLGTWRIDDVTVTGTLMTCPTKIYVDDSITGGDNNGFNWKNAFTDLNLAITWRNANCNTTDVWVAAGTYTDTFPLSEDIKIYGGFAAIQGSEGLNSGKFDEQSVRSGTTTLKGNGNDRVVTIDTGINVTLERLTISGGNANGTDPDNNGGGIYNDNGSMTLSKVTLTGNTASNHGGGMYNNGCGTVNISGGSFTDNSAVNGGGMYNLNCSPNISSSTTPVTFTSNIASGNGGAIYNDNSNPQIKRIYIQGNSAVNGGGIYNAGTSNPPIDHAVVSGNKATTNGGGMYSENLSSIISQVTFSGNLAGGSGGGIYNAAGDFTINNSIFWQNKDGGGINESGQIHVASGTPKVNYSIVEDGSLPVITNGWTGSTDDIDPITLESKNTNANPIFKTSITPALTTAGDFHLNHSDSAALDAGKNSYTGEILDLDKKERKVQVSSTSDPLFIVDMGPYETEFPVVETIECNNPSTCDNA